MKGSFFILLLCAFAFGEFLQTDAVQPNDSASGLEIGPTVRLRSPKSVSGIHPVGMNADYEMGIVIYLTFDSLNTRTIKLTGLPSGYTGDSCLILKNGVPSIISASAYRVMIGAAAALHQHDSLYFRETELTDGSTDLWLDSIRTRKLRAYGISSDMDVNVGGELYVDYNADITYDLHVGDDLWADSIIIRQLMLNGASYYVPPVGEQWAMDCMLGLKNDLVYKLSGTEVLSFAGAAAASHTHDDRYYTKLETGSLFFTKTELTNGSTDLSVADITANSVYANMSFRIGAAVGYAPNVAFNYIAATPYAYFVDTDAATEAATICRLGFMCQATKGVVGRLDYASSTLTLENKISGGGINLTTDGGRVTVDGGFTVGSVGGYTRTANFLYGHASPYMYVVDTDAANNTGVAAWHSFVCAATDSVLSYFGFLSTGNSDLFLRNRCYSGSLKIGTRGNDNIVIEPDGDVTMSGDLAVTDDLTADSISGRVIKVPGDTSYSATFTLYDGTTSRGTATAYIAKDAQRRIAYVSLATKTGTITASTLTTLTFSSNVLPDPVNGATVITGPLVSNSNDIAGVLWVKNNDIIELHSTNPWGYLTAGTGGVTNTDFSYRY